uniref:Ribosomal protein L16 n=1 Tax=Sargassum yezoense TaxID=127449 RepID=A0A344AL83_9PHAE|nr:ribosomal protein L16 [Sargassum yezoense]YP_010485625.1 ribosomal protein L16 [Sargassum fulvellum]YP_010485662.1 ribosomal protein L16 [Sargassum macrocarpum]AWV83131.1 ribosomal protein L16 [Sargassum yezoense]UVW81697.1 ribosomal protein L16 [Sargassum fulvellum]UVW81771.1 ribosomal protein L16 [Sargassum macrocarpum]
MLLQPKKTKYKKYFKPRSLPRITTKTQKLNEQNCFAIISLESGYINVQQLEAARQNIRRKIKREGKLEIIPLADKAISNKPTSARMGKGKGKGNHWVAPISAGKPILLLYGIDKEQGFPALKAGANKLPLKIKIRDL